MKKIIILISLVFLCAVNVKAQPFGGGDGTELLPYKIYTKEHLEELADSVNNGYNWSKNKFFHLMNDIDDSVRTVIGIGPTSNYPELVCLLRRKTQRKAWKTFKDNYEGKIDSNLSRSFQGYFNGKGHQITLAINMPTKNNIGLFGCVSGDGLILDLDIDGYVIGKSCVGGVVGYLRKLFTEQSFYMISECVNYATITSTDGIKTSAGGIIGVAVGNKNNSIFIDRCRNNGLVNNTKFFYFEDTAALETLIGSVSKELVIKFRSIYE